MIKSIVEFSTEWKALSDGTRKMMDILTDESLSQNVAEDHRTLGRMAWHIVATIPEMAGHTGLKIEGPAEKAPVPASAKKIKEGYDAAAKSIQEQIEAVQFVPMSAPVLLAYLTAQPLSQGPPAQIGLSAASLYIA